MEKLIICANCGKEVPEEKSVFHELKKADISWNNCYECEEHLSTHGDKPFVAPEEESYSAGTVGSGRMRNAKEVLQDLIEKARKDDNLFVIDPLNDNSLNELSIDPKEEQVREFNEVINYFKGLMEKHGIVARIISDNIDHKYFMDELNNRINSRNSNCIMVLNNRIWICTSNNDIVKLAFIDDRTTKKDLTTEVKARIVGMFQESEMANMRLRHEKELDLLRGINRVEHPAPTAASIPQPPVSNRSRRL